MIVVISLGIIHRHRQGALSELFFLAIQANLKQRARALVDEDIEFALQEIQRNDFVEDTPRWQGADEVAQRQRERRIALRAPIV